MKIENTILLQGALSRNRKILSLKKGNIIQAEVLERIDRNRAVINMYGNRLTALFENGVPETGTIRLKILSRNDKQIVFTAVTDGGTEKGPEMSRHLGVPLPLIRQLFLQGPPQRVADLLFLTASDKEGGRSGKRRPGNDSIKDFIRKILSNEEYPLTEADSIRDFTYMVVEDGGNGVAASTVCRQGLFYASFELGGTEVELTTREIAGRISAFIYCDNPSLQSALNAGLDDFSRRTKDSGMPISLAVIPRNKLYEILLIEIEKNTEKNIVDYTA